MNVEINQQRLVEQDMLDRDRQASSLAYAGMVADNVSSPHIGPSAASSMQYLDFGMLDSNNGGDDDFGPTLDEMETDFAKLFDPQNELKYMENDFDNGALPLQDDVSLIPGLEGHISNCQP